MDLSFFSSDTGVAIAWICTVFGFGYAFFQKSQIIKIKQELNILNTSYDELIIKNENLNLVNNQLEIKNNNFEQKNSQIESNEIRDNHQNIIQTGKNNINQGVVKGDVNIGLD